MYTKYPEVFLSVRDRMAGNISTDPKAIKKSGNANFCIEQTVFETLDFLETNGMLKKPKTNGFQECESCAKKPGSPTLCRSCLHNREVINGLR